MRIAGFRFFLFVLFLISSIYPYAYTEARESLTLYEKIAWAQYVIVATVINDDEKYALVSVEENVKGNLSKDLLNVSFRRENLERELGEPKIEFTKGETVVLFLEPFVTASGKEKKDVYSPVGRAEGKISVSAESVQLISEAMHRFVKIQALDDQRRIWEEQKALLKEKNRFMVEAGFEEVIKFKIASQEMIPALLAFVRGEDSLFRAFTCTIFGQLFEKERRQKTKIEGREEILRELIQRARGDDAPSVRIEAIRAIEMAGGYEYREILEAISKTDNSQDVRYEAERVLYGLRSDDSERE